MTERSPEWPDWHRVSGRIRLDEASANELWRILREECERLDKAQWSMVESNQDPTTAVSARKCCERMLTELELLLTQRGWGDFFDSQQPLPALSQ